MGNILITGGTGFVGSHMVDYILKYAIKPDQKVYCTKRWMEDTKNLDHINHDSFEYIDCDLLDGMSVKERLRYLNQKRYSILQHRVFQKLVLRYQ